MQHKTAFGAISAVAATAGILLSAAPAAAQEATPLSPASCDTGVLSYPPGATAGRATVSNANPQAGQSIVASVPTGSFDPRTPVVVRLDDVSTLGTVTSNAAGAARISVRVPSSVQPGVHIIIFNGTLNGATQQVGACVATTAAGTPISGGAGNPATNPEPAVPAAPAGPGGGTPISGGDEAPARPSALPFTGSAELVTVAGLGAALLALGAGTVVVARRRRDEAPLAV